MTDKEMLERAARAGGLIPIQWVDSGWLCETQDGTPRFIWNSLDSSADAFELAVVRGITDLSLAVGKLALENDCQGLTGVAVARRAITRAAAEMYAK